MLLSIVDYVLFLTSHLLRSKPPITEMITNCFRSRHCTRQFARFDDSCASCLNSLQKYKRKLLKIHRYNTHKRLFFRRKFKVTSINSFFTQWSSFSASVTESFPDCTAAVAWRTSGNCVDEWLPQMMTFCTSRGLIPKRLATCKKIVSVSIIYSNLTSF